MSIIELRPVLYLLVLADAIAVRLAFWSGAFPAAFSVIPGMDVQTQFLFWNAVAFIVLSGTITLLMPVFPALRKQLSKSFFATGTALILDWLVVFLGLALIAFPLLTGLGIMNYVFLGGIGAILGALDSFARRNTFRSLAKLTPDTDKSRQVVGEQEKNDPDTNKEATK